MNLSLVLPILIPLTAAAAMLLLGPYPRVQRGLGVLASFALLVASGWLLGIVQRQGIQVVQIGDWPAPFGVSFVADLFSALMVLVAALVGFAVAVYSWLQVDRARQAAGYWPLLHVMMMGICGAFLTGDLFNLYVWFEVMLIASFVLLALGGERGQLEGALKYLALNFFASAAFLAGVGVLYAATGTLNMADLSVRLAQFDDPRIPTLLSALFLLAFGIKSAVFPLFFWLPASYHTPPAAISAVFAGLLTKVGVYALIRVFTLLFIGQPHYTHNLLLAVAGLTMMTGVLGAMVQYDLRRILSFHIISQIGYMVMGLALYTPLALAGSVFYLLHHIVVKTNLFLVAGVIERLRGTGRLEQLGGLYPARPGLAVLFLIPALSLAGLPPLSGFFAKLILVRAGLETRDYAVVAVALVVSLLTLYSMNKIWNEVFWKPLPEEVAASGVAPAAPGFTWQVTSYGAIILLAAVTVLIGFAAGPLFAVVSLAAEQLMDPERYIHAVLGETP